MPLSDTSKSKVSLSSLSATTAAAAESLWSRSKKSAKKKKQIPSQEPTQIPEVSSSRNSISEIESHSTSTSSQLQVQQPLDRQEFRRRFLDGLQFYCENSSLILNSDLPADLIEFVTSHGFSVESLGIILELKKSSSAFSSVVNKKPGNSSGLGDNQEEQLSREQNFSEVSRRLLQNWMSADSCAEAFVSLSLGEEIPGLIAECASFQRILFAVPDNFRIAGKEYLNFLLSQVLLAINALSFGIKTSCEIQGGDGEDADQLKIRTQVIASLLDRIFARYFSDSEYFYTATPDDSGNERNEDNPFLVFIEELSTLCERDVIARRLASKIFLHFSSQSASKLAKIVFCCSKKDATSSCATTLFYPATEFLEKNSHWKHILESLPVKTVTRSKAFWHNWAFYIEKESRTCHLFWKECVDHWIILNKSPHVDEHSLFSATVAVLALARQINKSIGGDDAEKSNLLEKLDAGSVLENVTYSLESTNEKKKVCGMALAEVVSELVFIKGKPKSDPDAPKKLKFDCKSSVYFELKDFYKHGFQYKLKSEVNQNQENKSYQKIQVLDSDDDEDDISEESTQKFPDDGFTLLTDNSGTSSPDVYIDPRVTMLRTRKRKIPMYFSEILETLLEGSKNEDEAEILKYIVVLKIPVLLFTGVKIDTKIGETICRCVADMEDDTSLQIPILFAIYELFSQHPAEVADLLGNIVFDKDRYTLGQRAMTLNRLLQIVQLSSKQSCFNCYSKLIQQHQKELLGICPEFVEKYFLARRKLRFCQQCQGSSSSSFDKAQAQETAATTSNTSSEQEESLTWREIVDRRVAAKTRYFVTSKSKSVIPVPDEYSSKLVVILWSSIANRLTCEASVYLDEKMREKSGKMYDALLVNVFQYLSKCIFGTSGPNCPHLRNLASHAGELMDNFINHQDANVRRSVLSLLAVILCVSEGKTFVIEALSSRGNIFNNITSWLNTEKDFENRKLVEKIQEYIAGCTAAGMLQEALNVERN